MNLMSCPVLGVQVKTCVNAVRRDVSAFQDKFLCDNGFQISALPGVGVGLLPFDTSDPGAAQLLTRYVTM